MKPKIQKHLIIYIFGGETTTKHEKKLFAIEYSNVEVLHLSKLFIFSIYVNDKNLTNDVKIKEKSNYFLFQ